MELALGRLYAEKITLFSLRKEQTLPPGQAKGVLVSSLDCRIHRIPTKLKAEEQIRSFCAHYLKTVHPGPYDDLASDHLLVRRGKERFLFLVIMERAVLESYRRLGLPFYFFFQLDFPGRKKDEVWVKAGEEYERYRYDKRGPADAQFSSAPPPMGALRLPSESLAYRMAAKRPKQLFQERPRKKRKNILLPGTLAALLLLFAGLGLHATLELNRTKELYRQKQELIRRQAAERQENAPAVPEEGEISDRVRAVLANTPADRALLLSRITGEIRNRVALKSLKINRRTLTMSGSTYSALQLVEDLEKTGLFAELTPSRIYPKEEGGEDFSLTGVFYEPSP